MFPTDFINEIKTNPNAGQSGDGFDNSPLPAGNYDFVITGADEKPFCAKVKGMKQEAIALYLAENQTVQAGKKLVVKAKVLDGAAKDREVWWFFTLIPASDMGISKNGDSPEQQVKFDWNKLQGLIKRCHAEGATSGKDLLGCTLRLKVDVWEKNGKSGNNFAFWVKQGEEIAKPGVVTSTAPIRSNEEPPF